MYKALHQVGEYVLLMKKSITLPDRWSMFFKQLIKEGVSTLCGLSSLSRSLSER